jgi:Uncharacterized protein conserved in bacteria
MTDKIRLFIKPGDVIIYLLVITAAVVSVFAMKNGGDNSDKLYAEVNCSGVKTAYPLDTDTTVNLSGGGYSLILVISDGCAYISHSDCPDQICVHTGKISSAGQAIVCVPARISVKIMGGTSDGVDAVAG